MAEIIDPFNEDESSNQLANQGAENLNQDNPQEPEDKKVELPSKYQGKSVEEIVKMHQEAEKLIGRQAQEVGESRRLLDDLIRQQLESKVKDTVSPQTQEIDFYDDPAKAVDQRIENNPTLRRIEEQLAIQKQQDALATIQKSHPDYLEVAQTPEFVDWIKASKVRLNLYASAANYDVDSALELLDTFKSISKAKQQTIKEVDEQVKQSNEETRKQALKSAGVQTGGTGESTKPVYRYADIRRLMLTDRRRYNDMAEELIQAYAEGRVIGRPS